MEVFEQEKAHQIWENGGVSHCPEEWTDYEDIKKGADVLLHLVMELSKQE